MPAASTLKGTGSLTFWAATNSGNTTDRPTFTASLELLRSDGTVKSVLIPITSTTTYQAPAAGWGCTGFRPFTVQLPISGQPVVALNEQLRVNLKVSGATMRVGYGTADYPSGMQLPYKNGNG